MEALDLKTRYPDNAVITDDAGRPSVMVYVPRFYLDEVIDGASHLPHPAFVVGERVLDGVYISKFQNVVIDGRAYSLPDKDPAVRIDFDAAHAACTKKGAGFHLMNAAEWGAIALWCQKNGWLPFGNNDYGRDAQETQTTATVSYCDEASGICRVATGTGPVEWSHNRRADGIYDLNGNVWEWNGGIRLVFGELQILPDPEKPDAWRAIDAVTGELIQPDGKGSTHNSVKLDFVEGAWQYVSASIASACDGFRFCAFVDVTAHPSVCRRAKEWLYALGCMPTPQTIVSKEVSMYANNGAAERMAFRGGRWGQGANAGVFKTCFDDPRTYSGDAVGFRAAYYSLA
ncbi:MAG: SUMF1/EgtB/PvdO family nonheme iron enzyme [Clostridia bacterium]|nr:SUMF1/EgtB/PvdO family nonheme iron enzyme [Clostridia bacterium]